MEDILRQKQMEMTANRVTPLDRRIAVRAKIHSNDQGFSDAGNAGNPGELARFRHLKELVDLLEQMAGVPRIGMAAVTPASADALTAGRAVVCTSAVGPIAPA